MTSKHLFFDLDRTLWDFETNSEQALNQLFHESRLKDLIPSFPKFLQTYKNENALQWKKYGKGKITKEELRIGRFSKTLSKFEIYENELVEYLSDGYIQVSPYQTALFPNAIETLMNLKKSGYQMHIITNGFKEVQHIKLEKSALTTYFDLILCSEEVGVNKPNSAIFKHAMTVVGSKPQDSVMIGDDFDVDILGALNCGMHAVHFDPQGRYKKRENDNRIRNLSELEGLLPWIFR